MDRRDFFKKSLIGGAGIVIGGTIINEFIKEEPLTLAEQSLIESKKRPIVLLNDEYRLYFTMEPDETGRIKLIDLYKRTKEEWKEGGWTPYPFPLIAITPEMFETTNGWYIANPEMLYGGSVYDREKDAFCTQLIDMSDIYSR